LWCRKRTKSKEVMLGCFSWVKCKKEVVNPQPLLSETIFLAVINLE